MSAIIDALVPGAKIHSASGKSGTIEGVNGALVYLTWELQRGKYILPVHLLDVVKMVEDGIWTVTPPASPSSTTTPATVITGPLGPEPMPDPAARAAFATWMRAIGALPWTHVSCAPTAMLDSRPIHL